MKKKSTNRIISVVLCFIMVIAMSVPVFADDTGATERTVIYNEDNTIIETYENSDGETVLEQYVDGQLVQKNVISLENTDIIERTFYVDESENTLSTPYTDEIRASDYITIIDESEQASIVPAATNAYIGTINYRSVAGSQISYYGLRCSYTTSDRTTTYTINGYVGPLIDLVSILVGALSLPVKIVSQAITAILSALGINIVGGIIEEAVTATVAATETKYTWTLQDTTNASHRKNVYGYQYDVIETGEYYGQTFYEGYTPKDWGTQALAVWFHNEMFPPTSFDVVSWS